MLTVFLSDLLNCCINALKILLPLTLRDRLYHFQKRTILWARIIIAALNLKNLHNCVPYYHPCHKLCITGGQVFGSFLYTVNSYDTAFLMAPGIPAGTWDSPEAHSDLGHCLQVQRLSSDKISLCLPIAFTHVWPPVHSTEHVQLLCSLTALQRQS